MQKRWFCVSRKGGTGGGGCDRGWVTRRVLCTWQLLGLAVKEWANSYPGYMNRPRKRYSHLLGCSFLTGKAAWALSGYLPTENADYCMFVNEWARLRSQVHLLRLKVHLDSVLESDLRQN